MVLMVAILAVLILSLVSGVGALDAASAKYLEAKAKEEGVMALGPEAPGMLYKVLHKGDGMVHPTESTPCDAHYKGSTTDGKQIDSSYDRGEHTTFTPKQMIKGLSQAMLKMVEGDKWELYIPPDLAYGDTGMPGVPGGTVLVWELEIVKIKQEEL
eukprot:gnl/TRDRNA2_/TRDRNA2_195381_c0_seq1.p1 gnl/TRDRNA2_/TRDRNA2_195381_c0~~gnl/TRDRNA2_/TRDRNA2_195381_c0_seq1.p1  ORF type:complete len:156 (-),score=33.53 gnl/TRDRNA2_/TRDRNA2_195381_c0_seq1:148-615(-)